MVSRHPFSLFMLIFFFFPTRTKISTRNLWPLMRLLLPQLDSDRSTYGLRESSIADMYIKSMGIAPTSEAAERLKNYRNPNSGKPGYQGRGKKSDAVAAGDFTTILYDVLKTRAGVQTGHGTATIESVNNLLDTLHSTSDKDAKKKICLKILKDHTAREQFWLARIIIKDMKMGVTHNSMLKIFHPQAEEIYNTCTSLKTVCELVADPAKLKTQMKTIQLFQPMKPMLCHNPHWRSVVKLMHGAPFAIEPKFDGERILIHKQGTTVKLYTRNAIDYTDKFNYGNSFIPVVLKALAGCSNCILDGELLTWDNQTGQYASFGANRTTAMQGNKVNLKSDSNSSRS